MHSAKPYFAFLVALPLVALAQGQSPPTESAQSRVQEGQSSSSCVSNITFSQDFLTRYPNAGGACREVRVEDGRKWARFDAEVVQVRGNRVTADFVDRADRKLGKVTFDAPRDGRIMMGRREMRFSSLRQGNMLSFWVPEGSDTFYTRPGTTSDTTRLALVSQSPTQR